MINQKRFQITGYVIVLMLTALLMAAESFAGLRIDSVYPNLGVMGQNLPVTITGSGFDASTRVSMSLDAGNKKAIIGSVSTQGSAFDVAVMGDTAYVANGSSGLQIIDISNPSAPFIIKSIIINSLDSPGHANGVAVIGDTAYVTYVEYKDQNIISRGLQLIDVSDSSAPSLIKSVITKGEAYDVAVAGSTAYVADGSGGLQIIDVSNPSEASIIGKKDIPGDTLGVAAAGNIVYVTYYDYEISKSSTLQLIDVSTPSNPSDLQKVEIPGRAKAVTVINNTAYVANHWASKAGLQVIDLSTSVPSIVGSVPIQREAQNVTVFGDTAYVVDAYGLHIIDVSNPSNPFLIGVVETPGHAKAVAVIEDTAYVADNYDSFQVIDVSNPSISPVIGSVDKPGEYSHVAVVGDVAYVADEYGGLKIINISKPSEPSILKSLGTPGIPLDVTVNNGTAYVALAKADSIADSENGLQLIDVNDPSNPILKEHIKTPAPANSIKVIGNTAYVAADDGLHVIDITNPSAPSIKTVSTPWKALDVAVVNKTTSITAFVVGYTEDESGVTSGFQVINVTDPSAPSIIVQENALEWGYVRCLTLFEDKAYVGDDNVLKVIDVQDLSNPSLIKEMELPGWASEVIVNKDTATVYVAGGSSGIQMIDVNNPSAPSIIGSVETTGVAYDVAVIGDTAFVADKNKFLIVPVPLEITPITVNSPTSISLTLPSPQIAGHYTLRVFNGAEFYELPGAVTFAKTGEVSLTAKAIILAGKGPGTDNLWHETQMVADHAYEMLRVQGFTDDRIHYLSLEPSSLKGVTVISPTQDNLSNSITQWAKDASDLVLYFVGHGGTEVFNISPDETIEAATLAGKVSELQTIMTGKVIFIYDACQSGTFIQPFTSSGKNRVIITSGSNESSWFINGGYTSFSYKFWSFISSNANLNRAYDVAKEEMTHYYQTALLDANNNGITDESDDKTIADNILIGRGRIVNTDMSVINNVSAPLILNDSTNANLWADNISLTASDIQKVWAEILPPDWTSQADLPQIELLDPDNNGRYEYDFTDFTTQGTYTVNIYISDIRNKIYQPELTTVTQTSGNKTSVPDIYEEDNIFTQAKVIFINNSEPQSHNFHESGDTDWIKIYALAGQTYLVKTSKLSSICDTVIQIYDTEGSTMLKEKNSRSQGGDEELYWTCNNDGLYYVQVKNNDPNIFGGTTRYDLEVYQPYLTLYGTIKGIVTSLGNPVKGVSIVTADTGSALSDSSGIYRMNNSPGTIPLIAQKDGYKKYEANVILDEKETETHHIYLIPLTGITKGDINQDGNVDLKDAITGLQIMADNTDLPQKDYKEADVNEDSRIGLEDVIYVLQNIAG